MTKHQLIILLLCSWFSHSSYAQTAVNLIPHPSFEPDTPCFQHDGLIDSKEMIWKSYIAESPDLFSCCYVPASNNRHPFGTPSNFVGYQKPKDGCSYAGVGIYIFGDPIVFAKKENIGVHLSQKLVAGGIYSFSGWFSRANKYRSICDSLHFTFLDYELDYVGSSSDLFDYITPNVAVSVKINAEGIDTTDWTEVKFDYVARGGEQYLYLGPIWNSLKDLPTCALSIQGPNDPGTYYEYFYIDDLKLQRTDSNLVMLPNVFTPNGDLHNDFYSPGISESVNNIEWKVFNRWGQLMFANNTSIRGWDGINQFSNLPCPEGVYYVSCSYRDPEGKVKHLNSYIHLIR